MFSLESLNRLSAHNKASFMSLVISLQDLKAMTADNQALAYQFLPTDSQERAIQALFVYLRFHRDIRLASDIHRIYIKQLVDDGWTFSSEFSYEKKCSPMLCLYKELPSNMQTFLNAVFILIKNMAPIHEAAFKEVNR